MADPGEITALLRSARRGDRAAEEAVCKLVYSELLSRARARLFKERPTVTLSSGALVHEAFLKLFRAGSNSDGEWQDRAHFYKVAARAMRQVVIDHARKRNAKIHGGSVVKVSLDVAGLTNSAQPNIVDVIALGEACRTLETSKPHLAEVVDLRFFAGLQTQEIANILGVSRNTVSERIAFAKAFLHRELTLSESSRSRCAAEE